ncbi:MAG TPA: hypothetical protein VGM39_21350 [Kofleriaceae bacterium]
MALAVAVVSRTPDPAAPSIAPAPVVEIIPAPTPIDDTVAVEFLSSDQLPTSETSPPIDESPPAPSPLPAIATTTRSMTEVGHAAASEPTTTTNEPPTTTSEPGPSRNRYMDMRRNQVDLHLPGHQWDDSDWVPAGTDAQQPITSGRLKPNGTGSQTNEGQLVATVDADGNVKFGNKKNFHAHIALPNAHELGDMLQGWYYDENKPVGTLAPPHPPEDLQMGNGDVVSVAHEGIAIVPPGPGGPSKISDDGTIPVLGGGFDVTDAFMRRHGQDPYASQKLAYLDATRDERVEIGMKHRAEQLSHVAQLVQKSLAQVWALPDLAAKKQALFEMWDECVESGSEEMVGAGIQARHLVIGFIRARLPAGSRDAFITNEIAALNRQKQSKATFAPYDSP